MTKCRWRGTHFSVALSVFFHMPRWLLISAAIFSINMSFGMAHAMQAPIHARLQFLVSADEGGTATYYASEAGVIQPADHQGQFCYEKVLVENGRSAANHWNVDRQGFQLVSSHAAVQNFYYDSEVEEVYYREVEELILKHVEGATWVHIFDHTRRASTPELRKELNVREPSAIVHNDYTEGSAKKRLFDMLKDEAEALSSKRFAIINTWRSIAGTVKSSPLAVCDSTSIDPEKHLVSVKRVAKDRIGELQMALYDKNHKWYYFPEMTPDEVLIFKTFDSSENGDINRFTLHTAMDGVGDSSVPRQSIETRAFVFF